MKLNKITEWVVDISAATAVGMIVMAYTRSFWWMLGSEFVLIAYGHYREYLGYARGVDDALAMANERLKDLFGEAG